MPKSRKKKYKKKKNPARAPQAPKQTSAARVQAPKATKSGGQAPDPNRQRQMWIALAIALGVFLLLILVARLTGGNNTTPDAETVQETGEVAEGGDSLTEDGDTAEASETDTTAQDTDAADTTSDNGTSDADMTTTTDTTAPDNGTSDAATTTDADTTTNSDNAAQDSGNSADTTTPDAGDSGTTDSGNSGATDAPAAVEYADILVKDYGTITVELDPAAAPITVQNFVDLAKSGFYDGLTFHRIMDGFMIQGGDPSGNGTGGSDKNIVGEFASNGYTNNLSHTRGTISMARASGDNDSASSQFFIVHKDSTFLDGDYAAFGHVTSGMDVVDEICADAKPTDDNGTIPADEQPIIESITIREQ